MVQQSKIIWKSLINLNFQILRISSIFFFMSKNLTIQRSSTRRRSFRPSVRIVSSKEPTARNVVRAKVTSLDKDQLKKKKGKKRKQKKDEKEKESIKKSCTKRMSWPVRDHIGHTDLAGWQPPGEFLDEEFSCPSIFLLFEQPVENIWRIMPLFSIILLIQFTVLWFFNCINFVTVQC